MTSVLTQEDIDQLLKAVCDNDEDTIKEDKEEHNRKVKIYDFKRPDVFSKDNVRSMCMIHEIFARLTTNWLSSKLKQMSHIHVASVDQLTTEEFIRSIPTPTSLAIINMDPLNGNAVIEIDPAITVTILDLLTGGKGKLNYNQHELTSIEMSIMESIFVRSLASLRESFTSIIDLRPRIGQLETNPQFCYVASPTEMGMLVTLETRVCDTEGMINIFYPREVLRYIINKLSYSSFYPIYKKEITNKLVNTNDVVIPIIAELGRKELSIKSVSNLKPSDMLAYFNKKDLILRTKNNIKIANYSFEKDNKIKVYNIRMEKMAENKVNLDYETGDINKIKVQMIAELGRKELNLGDIKNFKEGDIVELDAVAGEPANIFANNVLIAKGEVVVVDQNFGIRILDIL